VHGIGGMLGALLTGVFATRGINPIFKDASGNPLPLGLIDGHGAQVLNQLIAVGITIGLTMIGTLVLLKIVDLLIGVRVSHEAEQMGLDLSQHGESVDDFDSITPAEIIPATPTLPVHAPVFALEESTQSA
jgi:Amt family ammonium transporter